MNQLEKDLLVWSVAALMVQDWVYRRKLWKEKHLLSLWTDEAYSRTHDLVVEEQTGF